MTKKIIVNKQELIVEELYPFRYDYGKGKEVLRIKISEVNHSFEEIKDTLKNCKNTIEYYIDGELKNEYENYSVDFNCQYQDGIYSIEVTRLSQQEQDIESLNVAVMELAEIIGGAE